MVINVGVLWWAFKNVIQKEEGMVKSRKSMNPVESGDVSYEVAYKEEKRRRQALGEAVTHLQNELLDAREQIQKLMIINSSGEKQMFNQKDINHKLMTLSNEKEQEYAAEIERLRELVKQLGGDPN